MVILIVKADKLSRSAQRVYGEQAQSRRNISETKDSVVGASRLGNTIGGTNVVAQPFRSGYEGAGIYSTLK